MPLGEPMASFGRRLMVSELNVYEPDDDEFIGGRDSEVPWSTGYALYVNLSHIALNTPRQKAIESH